MNSSVLLIDKDPAVIDVLRILLNLEGFEVIISDKPFNIEQVKYHNPAMILLHNGLNNAGAEICKEIKTCSDTQRIPVILTATESNLTEIAEDCGADAQIQKPFDINYLMELIKATIAMHRK